MFFELSIHQRILKKCQIHNYQHIMIMLMLSEGSYDMAAENSALPSQEKNKYWNILRYKSFILN